MSIYTHIQFVAREIIKHELRLEAEVHSGPDFNDQSDCEKFVVLKLVLGDKPIGQPVRISLCPEFDVERKDDVVS